MPKTIDKKMRAISNAIAGLIIFTFLLVVLVPLLLNMYSGSIHAHLALSSELASKLQEASQKLNITYDPSMSSPPSLRVYIVENNGPGDTPIAFYVVTDGFKTYLVKAANTYNKAFTIGALQVKTEPISDVVLAQDAIVVKPPNGKAVIRIINGRLLGAITITGSYIQVNTPAASSAPATSYSAVAGSIKVNYINLTSFNNIEDLFNNPDIIVTTDPSQNQSNRTLLNIGAINTTCFINTDTGDPDFNDAYSGGFQPVVDSVGISAVYIHNLGVWPGSMVLGGRGTSYSSNSIKFSLYMAGYDLIAYNSSEPGFIAISSQDNEYAFCYSFLYYGKVVSDCMPEGSANWGSSSLISRKLYDMVAENASLYRYSYSNSFSSTFNIVYTAKLGLVFWNKYFVAYCPPNNFKVDTSSGTYVFTTTGTCWFAMRYYGTVYEGRINAGSELEATSLQEIFGDNDAGIKGQARGDINYVISYVTWVEDIHEDKLFPMVVKLVNLVGDKNVLSIYDNVTGKTRRGVEAFGVYLYGGEYFRTVSGEYYVYYYVKDLYGEDGEISIFEFQPGSTSGLRPYMLLADTDGNGLSEIVLIDEWFGPDTGEDTLADLVGALGKSYHPDAGVIDKYDGYGCVEKTIEYFYIKFAGPYAVNGSQIAEVSTQVRYSFHDNLATDLDEVDDQMAGIWGFAVVDGSGNETASSLYIYQQLQNYEDTWPVSMPFHSDAVYLPIPDKPQLYFIVFKFGDPYSFYVEDDQIIPHDDADMTIRIEWLGMWYLHR